MYRDEKGDSNNLKFNATHYTQLAKYSGFKYTLGEESNLKRTPKAPNRYFLKKVVKSLLLDSTVVIPFKEISSDNNLLNQCYVPMKLTYCEALKVSSSNKSTSCLPEDSQNLDDADEQPILEEKSEIASSNDTEYSYWMKRSKEFNEKLSKYPNDEQLWLCFVKFQDEAFIHLFHEEKSSKVREKSSKATNRALLERKISLLDSAIQKNPSSIILQCERLRIGEHYWEYEELLKQWATLVYNFPNNMEVWNRLVIPH